MGGLSSGGLIIGRIFASEIWGAYSQEGLFWGAYYIIGILRHLTTMKLFHLLSSVAANGKDGNGLKLQKIGPIFSRFNLMLCLQKSPKILLWLALPGKIHLISSL